MKTLLIASLVLAAASTARAQTPAPAAAPAVVPAAPAAPAAAAERPKATPTLKADKEGFCQSTEFVGWSKEGSEAAYSESYCKQPPPDAAYDTLYLVTRDGRIKRWLIGAEAGPGMKLDTRAKLLFGEFTRVASPKSPNGQLTANAKVDGEYLVVTFTAAKDAKAPAPMTKEVVLPYKGWENEKAPTVGEIFWSPDSGALAITLKGVKKEPGGGKLPVASVYFSQIAALAPKAAAAPAPAAPAPAMAPAKTK